MNRLSATERKRIWLVSPYHTGSHQSWANGFVQHSRHCVRLLALDGRFWKWRMQGGALELAALAEKALADPSTEQGGTPDAILCTDMLNLPAWLALLRGKLPAHVPVLLYMHENQLTYPWRPNEKVDLTYALINWLGQCCAQSIAFNSHYHLDAWFAALPNLLKHFPDYNQLHRIDEVRSRSRVLPVGIPIPDEAPADEDAIWRSLHDAETPLILWNQRWEYDKRPERFFALLYRLKDAGLSFRLAVAGENFRNVPEEFEEARTRLADRIVHWGYVPDRAQYAALLRASDLVISTAEHEFFGIAILEAMAAGAFPLLPNRLSYPELIPASAHRTVLYSDEEELEVKAKARLASGAPADIDFRRHVRTHYAWTHVAALYDQWIDDLLAG